MNKYAEMAQRHWRQVAPIRYSQIQNPRTFFESLGEQVQAQVEDLSRHLAGNDQTSDEYLAKLGRLTAARRQAEEIALNELVWIAPERTSTEEFEEWAAVSQYSMQSMENWVEAMLTDRDSGLEPEASTTAEMAAEWNLPLALFDRISVAENPYKVLQENRATIEEAIRALYDRETTQSS